ncbi:hypothetical protein MHYP_G00053150 [Metynnis hypsauchen]
MEVIGTPEFKDLDGTGWPKRVRHCTSWLHCIAEYSRLVQADDRPGSRTPVPVCTGWNALNSTGKGAWGGCHLLQEFTKTHLCPLLYQKPPPPP